MPSPEPSPSPVVLQISRDLHGLRLMTRFDQDNIDSASKDVTDNCPISTTSESVSPARAGVSPRHEFERNSRADKVSDLRYPIVT